MHRSGTSCLTGSLQESGLELGDCHLWNPFNLKGNRENQAFVDLHDAILAANNGSWDHPPRRVTWNSEHQAMARELLAAHGHLAMMGFKDPRTLLVLEGWKQIASQMEFVGIFRHPNAVAASLERRSKLTRRQSLELWYHYNSLLLKQYQAAPFPILCFDAPEAEFQDKLGSVIEGLGLHRAANPQPFYEGELKTFDHTSGPRLPLRVWYLYRRLCAISV